MDRAGALARFCIALAAAGLAFGLAAMAQAQGPAAWPGCPVGGADSGPLLLGPGGADLGGADFGQVAEACPRSDVAARARASLLIDRPDFYGAVVAGATIRARYRLWNRWFASAAFDAFTWRLAANAVVQSTASSVGPGTLGVARSWAWTRTALAAHGRLLLPLDTARRHGVLWGADLGASAARQMRPRLALRGGVTLPATLAVVSQAGHATLRGAAVAEAAWSARPWLTVAAGSGLRWRMQPERAVAALAGRLSAEARNRCGWFLALGVDAPVTGVDRTDAIIALFGGWVP